MNTELKNVVLSTDIKAQYDECVKKLLGHKIILAHILAKSVDEFRGMRPEEVVHLIEGEPLISKVPVGLGLTNKIVGVDEKENEIVGLNTENSEVYAGYVRFDIIFYVRTKDGVSQIIINIEAQKTDPTDYDILNRAIFYISRMISSQKNREFKGSNYNDIKKVYSIWICMNMKEDSMNHIHLTNDVIMGDYKWKGKLELLNIIMVGVSGKLSDKDENNELHRLLGTLLSEKLKVDKKLDILEKEYDIPMEESIEEEVKTMCNLSEGIEERAMEAGRKAGIEEGRKTGLELGKKDLLKQQVQKKLLKGKDIDVIAEELEEEVAVIEKLIAELEQ